MENEILFQNLVAVVKKVHSLGPRGRYPKKLLQDELHLGVQQLNQVLRLGNRHRILFQNSNQGFQIGLYYEYVKCSPDELEEKIQLAAAHQLGPFSFDDIQYVYQTLFAGLDGSKGVHNWALQLADRLLYGDLEYSPDDDFILRGFIRLESNMAALLGVGSIGFDPNSVTPIALSDIDVDSDPKTDILAWLRDRPGKSYLPTKIANGACVSKTTTSEILKDLAEDHLIYRKKVGIYTRYSISPIKNKVKESLDD